MTPLSYPLIYYAFEQLKYVKATRMHHLQNKVFDDKYTKVRDGIFMGQINLIQIFQT